LEEDIFYMREAKLWSERSQCLSRHVGTVLVRDGRIISAGANGPSSGIPRCEYRDDKGQYNLQQNPELVCPRKRMGFKSGEGTEHCVAVHAEINSIMQAARMGISTKGTTLYCYCGTPCKDCTKEIIQSGIKRVVCLGKSGSTFAPIKDGDNPNKKDYNFPIAERLFELAGVQLDVISEEEVMM